MAGKMEITVKVEGLNELIAKLDPRLPNRPARNFFNRSTIVVQRASREVAPIWEGRLRDNIATAVDTAALPLWGTIGTNLPYGPAMEFGRPAGAKMPPPGALLPYMHSKGIPLYDEFTDRDDLDGFTFGPRKSPYFPVEFALARAIAKNGTKGFHFLSDGMTRSTDKITSYVEVFAREIEEAASAT